MKSHHFDRASAAAAFLLALSALPVQAGSAPEVAADAPPQLSADTPAPPDPGAAGAATVAGVDVNGNGVRDDLEPLLLRHFGKTPQLLRAVSNSVIGIQAAMAATNEQESARAHSMAIRAGECFAAADGHFEGDDKKVLEVLTLQMNTPQREAAVQAHMQRIADQNFLVSNDPKWDASCLVRADLIANDPPRQPRRE